MRILNIKRIPKRPYMHCAACEVTDNWAKSEVLAPNQLTFLGTKRLVIWLCDKHLEQLKKEIQEELK